MNAIRNYLKRMPILLGMLLLHGTLIGMLIMTGAQPAQAGPAAKKTKTPTPTPTSMATATQTPAPFTTPTPGPTTTVDGTWKIVSSPNVGTGTYGNQFNAVTVVSANDVWAVGYSSGALTQNPIDTLVLHWDGVSWSQVPSPNVTGVANQLFGITSGTSGCTPEGLVAIITSKVSVPHKIRTKLTAAAQFVENFKHRKTLVTQMSEAFKPAVTPSALHALMASLPLPLIELTGTGLNQFDRLVVSGTAQKR